MVSETITRVLERTVSQLLRLRAYYGQAARETSSPTRELATLLGERERDTVAALESWMSDDALATQAWVRQAGPFPYQPPTREFGSHPTARTLADMAEETDEELRALFERFRTYAAAEGADEGVAGLLAIVDEREKALAAALNELRHG